MSQKAVIDIGSNSIKFFVGRYGDGGTIETIADTNDVARLGEGLNKSGLISPDAMQRNVSSVVNFYKKARELGAGEIVAVGTMALRSARNSTDFVKAVKEACGLDVKILPGEEEARLSYLAVLSGLTTEDEELIVFDTGGGSTEFIFGRGTQLKKRFSLNLGSVRITENYLQSDPVTEEEVKKALKVIDSELAQASINRQECRLVGIGGTVTSMGAVKHRMVKYDPAVIQGSTLTAEDIDMQIREYSSRTIEERSSIIGLQPRRADVILAGACILKMIIKRLGADKLTISDRGLRHGLAFELFAKGNKGITNSVHS